MLVLWYITFAFLLWRFLVTALNYWFPQRLESSDTHPRELVSILIPARNEERNIDKLLRSIVNGDYKNYEVIVLDDDSADNTAQLVQQFRKIDSRVRLVKGQAVPQGTLGKNWACHQLSLEAKGKYLLFLDADVVIKTGMIRHALAYLKKENLALLSVVPAFSMDSRSEKLAVPLLHYLLISMVPLLLIRNTRWPFLAFASGQVMLFEADTYHKHRLHLSNGSQVSADTACMRLLRHLGFRTQTLLGTGYAECRVYKSFDEGIEDMSRNVLSAFGHNIPALILYLFFSVLSYLVFIWFIDPAYVWMAFMIIVYIRIMASKLASQDIFENILYHPWQMLNLVHVSLFAIQNHLAKTTEWKGRILKP